MCKWCDALCSELHKKRPLILLSASLDIIIVWTSFRIMIICRDDAMMNVQECREFPLHITNSLKLLHESTWTIFLTNFTVVFACCCMLVPVTTAPQQHKTKSRTRTESVERAAKISSQWNFFRWNQQVSSCDLFKNFSNIFFSVFSPSLSLLRFLLGVLSVCRAWFSCSHIIFVAAAALFFFSFSLKGRTPKNE